MNNLCEVPWWPPTNFWFHWFRVAFGSSCSENSFAVQVPAFSVYHKPCVTLVSASPVFVCLRLHFEVIPINRKSALLNQCPGSIRHHSPWDPQPSIGIFPKTLSHCTGPSSAYSTHRMQETICNSKYQTDRTFRNVFTFNAIYSIIYCLFQHCHCILKTRTQWETDWNLMKYFFSFGRYDTPGGLSTHKKLIHSATIHQPWERDQLQWPECGKW